MAFMHSDELDGILNELEAQTDRGAAIIASAILDELLTAVLQQRLMGSKTLHGRLFDYEKNGPLAGFSSKIDIALAVGVITQQTCTNLHLVRKVRNRFAHRVEPIRFSDAKIRQLCESMSLRNPKTRTPRTRYIMTVLEVMGVLDIIRQLTALRIVHIINDVTVAAQIAAFEATLDAPQA